MTQSQKSFNKLSSSEQKRLLHQMYIEQKKSFADIATELDTYPNKIRRALKAFEIPIRDKSDAQKNALKSGKHKHPTKGQKRPEDIKQKIGLGVMQSWEGLDDAALKERQDKAKQAWQELDDETKKYRQRMANNAVREASKVGSKLEKFLLNQLLQDGYKVDFHKEQVLSNTKLQIDLFLPTMNLAIEVDGPSHFLPVWGEDTLQKNIDYDQKKEGLILGKGLLLVRIKQKKDFSKTRALLLYQALKQIIASLGPKQTQKKFTIED